MKRFRIVAKCDPYNARKHYNGQTVLKYNGTSPVKWVMEDEIPSEEEAKYVLMDLAKTGGPYETGDWSYEDKNTLERFINDLVEDGIPREDIDTGWYKGPGIYNGCFPVLLEGESSFRDDTVTYSVEEIE
jgi:hypothetical protein